MRTQLQNVYNSQKVIYIVRNPKDMIISGLVFGNTLKITLEKPLVIAVMHLLPESPFMVNKYMLIYNQVNFC